MPTTNDYFKQAQLTLAAYADLLPGAANILELQRAGFSVSQANQYADKWIVIDQARDVVSGLSATVFHEIATGRRYLAIRGTDDLIDLATDVINVALLGTTSLQPQYLILRAKVRAWMDNGTLPANFTVAGHSLGGFLAVGIAAEFSANVEHAYLYNAPGLNGVLGIATAPILRALGISAPIGPGKVSNIRADAGVSPIAGLGAQLALPIRVIIENQFNSDVLNPPAARNHSQDTLTDALALYALFGAIDPAITVAQVSDLLKVASAQNGRTLEGSLDALRRIFGFTEATQIENRESFYDNLYGLQTDQLFRIVANTESGANASAGRIVSLVRMGANELASNAKADFGYLFALSTLSPFAVIRADNIARTAYGELYEQWQADQLLTAADRSAGRGNFSDSYLHDRAQFLLWKNQKNLNDIADDIAILRKDHGAESYLFTDKALKDSQGQGYSIRVVGGSTLQQIDPIRISFASDQGDTLQGGNYADHLYGGGGSDNLAGSGGDDYLEGGAGDDTLGGDIGDDTLIGGSGADTLIGGADDDILQGGKGDDILQGDAGNDVYLIGAGDGRDTILDHEGRNTIIYTDSSGQRSVFAVAAFAVAGQSNTWNAYLAGGQSISITRNSPLTATLPDGSQIVIDDYQDGDFGIQLKDLAQSEPESAGITLLGDLEPVHVVPIFDAQGQVVEWTYDEDEYGNPITDPSTPVPDRADWFVGSDDDDFIAGFGGEDSIYGGDGADRLQGGTGADTIFGESGDDVIEGQDDTSTDIDIDRISGGAGDDWIFAAAECDIDEAMAHANDAGSDSPGARMTGEGGDDVIVGSAGQDRIAGGAGCDVLIGGGGVDSIRGDADFEYLFNGQFGPNRGTDTDDADAIYGGGGGDWIRGGLGDDYVDGGDGDDFIVGESGADTLFGGAGDDDIYAIVNETNLIVFDESDDYIDGGDGDDWIYGSAGDNILLGGGGNDGIVGLGGDDYIEGGDGNDELEGNNAHGGAGDDRIVGTEGADTLYGDEGNDVLGGWNWLGHGSYTSDYVVSADTPGDDWLYGGAGDDTYIFGRGAGSAHIVDDSGVNRIVLMSYEISSSEPGAPDMYAPIAADSIRFVVDGGAYKLLYGDAGDSIDFGTSLGGATPIVELTRFGPSVYYDDNFDPELLDPLPSFGTATEAVSLSGIEMSQSSPPEGGTLIATEGLSNTLVGNTGSDILLGASRNDVLTGGLGDDTLDGGDGSDRYVFNAGDGVDIVSDSGAQGTDTLVFGPGIGPDALSLGTDALLIRIGESGDVVYVDGFDPDRAEAAGGIERFEFADGTVLSHAQLVSRGFDLRGTAGDDTAFGTNLVDRFHESAGNDSLIGGTGDDIYYFGLGSGHDFVIDLDATPNNSDTVVFGNGITADNLNVAGSAGLLTLAVAGTDDALAIQWRPQDGYAIERVQFADSTIWDSAMLESKAGPGFPADAGADTTDGGAALPAETPPVDAGTAEPEDSDTTAAANGAAPPADTGSADAGAGTPTAGETSETGAGSAAAVDAGPGDAATEAQTGVDSNPLAGGGAPPAEDAPTEAGSEIPMAGDTGQIGSSETPPPDIVTAEAGAGTTTGDTTNQSATDDAPAAAVETTDNGAAAPSGGDTHQAAGGATPAADSAQAEAGAGTATGGDAAQIDHGNAAAPAVTAIDAGSEAQTGGDTGESANAGTTPADTGTVDAAAEAPAGDAAVQIGNAGVPPLEAGSPGAEAAPADGDTIASAIDTGSAANGRGSTLIPGVPASSGSATDLPNLQSTGVQSRQDALLAALRVIGAGDFETAAELPRSSAKPLYTAGAQFASGQIAATPNPASFFTALRPEQPSVQAWLDNWLGPRARPAASSRDDTSASEIEEEQLPSEQDFAPLNLPDDLPEDQPEATLTSEEIAQSYQDIATWLDANPGIESATDLNGSPSQKNLFLIAAPGSASDGGLASMPWLDRSPGMAAIGGDALQPLRGLQEGHTALSVA